MLTAQWIKCLRDRGMTVVFDQISSVKGRTVTWQLDSIRDSQTQLNDEQRFASGTEYRQMLSALIEFLLGDQTYLDWLSKGTLPSEMENHTIIVQSEQYSPLLIDPFGQADQWMEKYYNVQTSHYDDECASPPSLSLDGGVLTFSSTDRNTMRWCPSSKRFSPAGRSTSRTVILSIVFSTRSPNGRPLRKSPAFATVGLTFTHTIEAPSFCLDSNLILYCGRRLYCNPSFRFYLHTNRDSLAKVSSSLALLTTAVNCQYSVETLLDDLRQQVFQRIQPALYKKKRSIYRLILLCQERVQAIDAFLKSNTIR